MGIEGTVAKPLTGQYPGRGGLCGWLKVRYRATIDAVVLGVVGKLSSPTALVLGRPGAGRLRIAGLATPLSRRIRTQLARQLRLAGVRRRAPGIVAGLPGQSEDFDFLPVEPFLVEVWADGAVEWGRFRHRLTALRVRLDL
ncbi:hypothetical protein [Amycolatopsis taiwanensis]|uniref:hypothetical protein n=1 Tax=Amycolatopsis taiwanensis TaxID=342230 RepID=UPI002557655F|nr:hypothetical protein [Amycolatopsis taiwanensis]